MDNKNVLLFIYFSPRQAVYTPLNPALDTTADLGIKEVVGAGFQL